MKAWTKRLVAVLGPTATGKSALALAIAAQLDGEIINCDSTAVYRGFDIGTDKVPAQAQHGIPHHLIDIVGPTDEYNAADYARDAVQQIQAIHARGKLPIVTGGTGLYFRALTRGIFPGAPRQPALRTRLTAVGDRRGVEFLWRMVARVDPASAARILPRDRQRLIRALEVYFSTGVPLTTHFAQTKAPLPAGVQVHAVALTLPREKLTARLAARVDAQLASGLLPEVHALLSAGVPPSARPFGGLVYRQVLEHLRGVRDLAATRDLIVQENRRYARRQLIWFRKEPTLKWFEGPGESTDVHARVLDWLREQ